MRLPRFISNFHRWSTNGQIWLDKKWYHHLESFHSFLKGGGKLQNNISDNWSMFNLKPPHFSRLKLPWLTAPFSLSLSPWPRHSPTSPCSLCLTYSSSHGSERGESENGAKLVTERYRNECGTLVLMPRCQLSKKVEWILLRVTTKMDFHA